MVKLFDVCNWLYKRYFWSGRSDLPDYYTIGDLVTMLFWFVTLAWWMDLSKRFYSWFVDKVVHHKIRRE